MLLTAVINIKRKRSGRMKNIFISIFAVILILSLSTTVFCATSGNPNDVQTPHGNGVANMEAYDIGVIKVGSDVEFVFKKDLKGRPGLTTDAELKDSHWYMGKVSYNIANRLDVIGLLGGCDVDIRWKQEDQELKFESGSDIAWGLGAKLFVYEFPESNIRMTASGVYKYANIDVEKITFAGADATNTMTEKEMKVGEWQAGVNFSREFMLAQGNLEIPAVTLVPYIGVRYSDSRIRAGGQIGDTKYSTGNAENEVKVGISLGLDMLAFDNFSLNVEGNFFDESMVSLGGTIKF